MIEAITPEEFWPKYDELAAAAPFLARKVANHKLPFALRRGDQADIEATVAALIGRARADGNADDLARLVVSSLRPREKFIPRAIPPDASDKSRQNLEDQNKRGQAREEVAKMVPPLPLNFADRMACAAYEINAKDSTTLSAMAEVASLRGEQVAAVDYQTRAVAAAPKRALEKENLRLADFQSAAGKREGVK